MVSLGAGVDAAGEAETETAGLLVTVAPAVCDGAPAGPASPATFCGEDAHPVRIEALRAVINRGRARTRVFLPAGNFRCPAV
jgi:hypothetical protein